jgi:uncharacterized protein (TIGR02594 family)
MTETPFSFLDDVTRFGLIRKGEISERVKLLQRRLSSQGHQLVEDGDFGKATVAALSQFQAARGLKADAIVGKKTAEILDGLAPSYEPREKPLAPPLSSVLKVAPWLTIMRAITGTKEFEGGRDNPVILAWGKAIVERYPSLRGTVGWYDHDSIPWCGLAVAYCVAEAGYRPPHLALGAKNWFNDWADGVPLSGPALGAIMVKSRAGGGHVTLYEGEDDTHYFCRGGNQSDMVNVARIRKDAGWLGFMWPSRAARPTVQPLRTTFAEAREATEA